MYRNGGLRRVDDAIPIHVLTLKFKSKLEVRLSTQRPKSEHKRHKKAPQESVLQTGTRACVFISFARVYASDALVISYCFP